MRHSRRRIWATAGNCCFSRGTGAGHVLPPHRINHRANVHALREAGADAVFATAAVGSLRTEIAPGDCVVLDDFLDFTKGDVTTFFDQPGQVRHVDFSHPYDPGLRETLLATAPPNFPIHSRGTYLCVSGPRYETPAEVRLFGSWGADVVGMTGAPEAILCREAGLRVRGRRPGDELRDGSCYRRDPVPRRGGRADGPAPLRPGRLAPAGVTGH